MPDQNQTCALRALTLCDGQVLEESEHALTVCPCSVLSDPERWILHGLARDVLSEATERLEPRSAPRRRLP